MSDERTGIVPAEMHGDNGVTTVVAETSGSERENGDGNFAMEGQASDIERWRAVVGAAQAQHQFGGKKLSRGIDAIVWSLRPACLMSAKNARIESIGTAADAGMTV